MPDDPMTVCIAIHATCIANKVAQFSLAPFTYNLAYELWLCDQQLKWCRNGISPIFTYLDMASELTTEVMSDLQDTLDSMRLWVQLNPGAATVGTVLVVGTIACIVMGGPATAGGVALVILTRGIR